MVLYEPKEIRGRTPVEKLSPGSKHDARDSIRLTYYIRTAPGVAVVDIVDKLAQDETTGPWVGTAKPTALFENAIADVDTFDLYSGNEAVVTFHSPVSNIDLDADPLYQLMMLAVGGPVLEFSYYEGVKWLDFELPEVLLKKFPGPQFGMKGIREITGLKPDEPVMGTIVKPCCGLTPAEVAEKCFEAAVGGARFIKADEKMLGPVYCRMEDYVTAVAGKLREAEKKKGYKTIFAPHIVARADEIVDVCKKAIAAGATGLMFNTVMGHTPEVLKILAEHPGINVPLYAHSGGRAALSTGERGVDDLVTSKIIRLCGADFFQHGVFAVDPNKGSHVASLDAQLLTGHIKTLQNEIPGIRDTIPVVAGGLHTGILAENLKEHRGRNGYAVALLAGSGLLKHPSGPEAGGLAFQQAISAYLDDQVIGEDLLREYARKNGLQELSEALK